MTQELAKIPEWRDVTFEVFRDEIYPRSRPAVMRGLVKDWPATREGAKSPRAFCAYVKRFDRRRLVGTLVAPPSVEGRFFYSNDMRGFNFERRKEEFGVAAERLLAHLDDENPPAVYIESVPIADCLPDFVRENALDFLDASVGPRIWMGNAVRVQTHYDLSDNIACVVAGRRRFTLFPPEQLPNLYMGPLEFTLSGAPTSMVPFDAPDFERFPRYREALAAAQSAELEPGDAIFIPYFWWHHVRSLERFNVLINYWWNDTPVVMGSPYDCLLHGVLALRDLPENQRLAWRAMFDYYVFKTTGEPLMHLPLETRGALGPMSPEQRARMQMALLRGLERSGGR